MTDVVTRTGFEVTLEQRQAAYRAIPPDALIDLAEFCRANESCFHQDPRVHAALEGRREVWLRIQDHLHLTPAQLMTLRQGKAPYVFEPQRVRIEPIAPQS